LAQDSSARQLRSAGRVAWERYRFRRMACLVGSTWNMHARRSFAARESVAERVCDVAITDALPKSTAGSRPPLLFECANLCRQNDDFRDAQTHAQPRAGDVSPPWLGNTSGVLEKSSTVQRHATDNQERGRRQPPVVRRNAFAMPPPGYSEHYRRSPGDRDCNNVRQPSADGLPHVCGIALANAFAPPTAGSRPPLFRRATVCRRTCVVSPSQTHLPGPRRADARRSCLDARISAGEMATFAIHERTYSQERGA
jgi:hypothetical protein